MIFRRPGWEWRRQAAHGGIRGFQNSRPLKNHNRLSDVGERRLRFWRRIDRGKAELRARLPLSRLVAAVGTAACCGGLACADWQVLQAAGDKITKQHVSGERNESDDDGGLDHGFFPAVEWTVAGLCGVFFGRPGPQRESTAERTLTFRHPDAHHKGATPTELDVGAVSRGRKATGVPNRRVAEATHTVGSRRPCVLTALKSAARRHSQRGAA